MINNLKGGGKRGDESAKRRAFGTGCELWVGLVIWFYMVCTVTELITDLVHSKIRFPTASRAMCSPSTFDLPESPVNLKKSQAPPVRGSAGLQRCLNDG